MALLDQLHGWQFHQCGGAGRSQTIEMTDVAADTVELLLQFIYGCRQQHNLTLSQVVALFQASDKYALVSLHHQCTRLLTAHISFGNIFQLADLAQLHNCHSLSQVGTVFPPTRAYSSFSTVVLLEVRLTMLPCLPDLT